MKRARSWSLQSDSGRFYASGYFGKALDPTLDDHPQTVLAQRYLLDCPAAHRIEFQNGNSLDCRRLNLLIVAPENLARGTTLSRKKAKRVATWMPNIPRILTTLEAMQAERIPTSVICDIFKLKRDAAIAAIRLLGGINDCGRLYLDRKRAINSLRELAASGEVVRDRRRIERVSDAIRASAETLLARQVTFKAPPADSIIAPVAEGVTITPRQLLIEYDSREQLLQRLMALALRWAKNPDEIPGDHAAE